MRLDGDLKVLDFGLVKSTTEKAGDAVSAVAGPSLATAGGLTPGTPAFMAPEMAVGESVDSRADIYALGCVAYYLLTGKLVFEAENPMRSCSSMSPNPRSLVSQGGLAHPRRTRGGGTGLSRQGAGRSPADGEGTFEPPGRGPGVHWSKEQAAAWWRPTRSMKTLT